MRQCNLVYFRKQSMASSAAIFTELANSEPYYIQVPYTEPQLIWTNQEWLSPRRYSRNLQSLNKVPWTSPKPNFMQIRGKVHNAQALHLHP
jgi:hypothetical protein